MGAFGGEGGGGGGGRGGTNLPPTRLVASHVLVGFLAWCSAGQVA